METTAQAFHAGLFEEHLDDIAFLYEQRAVLIESRDRPWFELAPFEARLEAHLDALVVGGTHALTVCLDAARGDDGGRLFGAVSVFCRTGLAPLLAETLKHLDHSDPRRVAAVADALKHELPEAWQAFIEQALASPEVKLTPLLAMVSGYRRLPNAAALMSALARDPLNARHSIEALGRLRAREAKAVLTGHLRGGGDAGLQASALLALLRSGAADALVTAHATSQQECGLHTVLALGAGRSAAAVLVQALRDAAASEQPWPASAQTVLALGLLGDPSTLRELYDCLETPALAEAAAQALQWITGALPDAEAFVPEPVDESLLIGKELNAWRQYKEAPNRLDGRPFGEFKRVAPLTKAAWKRWFAQHATRFDVNLRYRRGRPYAPATLLADLRAPLSGATLRRFAALELEIRYGCDVPFEVDMPVARQVDALHKISAWVASEGARFEPGRWYFNAEPQ